MNREKKFFGTHASSMWGKGVKHVKNGVGKVTKYDTFVKRNRTERYRTFVV